MVCEQQQSEPSLCIFSFSENARETVSGTAVRTSYGTRKLQNNPEIETCLCIGSTVTCSPRCSPERCTLPGPLPPRPARGSSRPSSRPSMSSRGEFLGSNSVQNCVRILGRHIGLSLDRSISFCRFAGQAIGGLAMIGYWLSDMPMMEYGMM